MSPSTKDTPGFDVQPLPVSLRLPTWLCDRIAPSSAQLTPEALTSAAARSAGLPARFPAHVEEALERLCRSYRDDARLHWFGRMNQRNLQITGLASLLKLEDLFRRRPELERTPLVPPLIVVGLPRSGTTFLHRLLAAAGDAHPLSMYEHIHPVHEGRLDLRRLDVEARFMPWGWASQPYGMDTMHFVRPSLPDECNFGMRVTGRSMIYWATAPTYGYLEWLLDQDLLETYRIYRKILLLHQARHPGKRLTLKCPHHLAWLPALLSAIPEALIVQTHRDPVQCVPSECKLVLSTQAMATHRLDWRKTVEHNTLKITTFADRIVAFDKSEQAARVLHIDYRGVVKDPVATAEHIRDSFGLGFSDADRQHAVTFAAKNRQHKRGKNHYSHAQFALDPVEIASRLAPYRERFLDS